MQSVSPTPQQSGAIRPVYDALSQKHLIEKDKRFSESCLWSLQAECYGEMGANAFQHNTVPSYGTGNAAIGRAYAELILGALLDMQARLVPGEPIYILELGGGSGRLAQYILKHLMGSETTFPFLNDVRYILSDAMTSMLDHWLTQPVFEPLVASGRLDFAVFDPVNQPSLKTHCHQQVLQTDTIKNPMIVVATYFFDTIAHDAFFIDNHQPHDLLVSLTRDAKKYSLNEPVRVPQLQMQERYKPAQLPYFDHPVLDSILSTYCELLEKVPLVIPTQGLRALENIQQLTSNDIVLITSDKGYGNPAEESATKATGVTLHGDAFSMCVNFDAIQRYIGLHHGCSMLSETPGLKTLMGLLPKRGESHTISEFPMASYWFKHTVAQQDILNQVLNLQHLYDSDYSTNYNARFDVFTAVVSLSHYDPKAFSKAFEGIRNMPAFTQEQADVLTDLLTRVEANIVGTSVHDDVFFELISLHQQLGNTDLARNAYDHIVRLSGVQPNLAILMGGMYQGMNQPKDALMFYQHAHQALLADGSAESHLLAGQLQHVIQQLQGV